MISNNNYELHLLFPKVVYTKIIEYISDSQINEIKNYIDSIEYRKIKNDLNENIYTSSSCSNFVLNNKKLFYLKEIIMKEFNFFKNNILKYENNNFIFTTSWIAKSKKNQMSEYHNHNNCMYSGLLYINTEENCGELSFEDFGVKRFSLTPSEHNVYNCINYNLVPKNKKLIFFPSELFHKILKNNSNTTRYSIAFNLIPIGHIGDSSSDSYLLLDV